MYNNIVEGIFLKRPNRFIAHVLIGQKEEIAHVKNTSRCWELLVPGARVLLEDNSMKENRKTKYSLIAVYKNDLLINIDSQIPNEVVYNAIVDGKVCGLEHISDLKREVKYKNSRFDMAFVKDGQKGFVEVKGVTLEQDGIVMFPGAPTTRGEKHVLEMIDAVENGYLGYIIFLVQIENIKEFRLHWEMDEKFSRAMVLAKKSGVHIQAYDSMVFRDKLILNHRLPLNFENKEPTTSIRISL